MRPALLAALLALAKSGCAFPLVEAPRPPVRSSHRVVPNQPAGPSPLHERWVLVSHHNHSVSNGAWKYTKLAEIFESEARDLRLFRRGEYSKMRNLNPSAYRWALREAKRQGIDAVIFTEHNTILSAHLPLRKTHPDLFRGPELLITNATEWTSSIAHVAVLGYRSKQPHDALRPDSLDTDLEDLAALVRSAKARGGFVVLSHPRFWFRSFEPNSSMGTHAVEVMGAPPGLEDSTRPFWHEVLVGRTQWIAMAQSDLHHGGALRFPPLGLPSSANLVRVDPGPLTESSLLNALRSGHVQPTHTLDKNRRILIGVDRDRDDDFEDCRAGDLCILGSAAAIQVRVLNARGLRLAIFSEENTDPMVPGHIEPILDDDQILAFERPGCGPRVGDESATFCGFLRAELWSGSTLEQLTNPVYFGFTDVR